MINRLTLDGTWELAGFDEGTGDWAWPEDRYPIPAKVPGEVHPALMAAGLIPDPYYGDNASRASWVEEKEWWYRRRFRLPEGFLHPRAFLEFDGLDTFATVLLNSRQVGESRNMFIPYRFDVTGMLREEGENVLEVRFASTARVAGRMDLDDLEVLYRHDRAGVRKMQSQFGWDWLPRGVGAGIWRSARLVSPDRLAVQDVHIQQEALEPDSAEARFVVAVENYAAAPVEATLEVRVSHGEKVETTRVRRVISAAGTLLEVPVTIHEPELWWPNGMGEQPLYNAHLELRIDGEVVDARHERFGLRTLELREREDSGKPVFYFVVNGEPVFAKGANWIPADGFPSRIAPEHYRTLLELARDAHYNMLRVWGGGIYEAPEFYDFCDEFGILVWQDFMFSFAEHPDTEEFAAAVGREAHAVVARLRNHPCLALWCGNNECELDTPPEQQWHGKRLFYEVIPQAVRELDPERPYWPSSPYSGPVAASCEYGDYHGEPWFHASKSGLETWRDWIDKDKGLFMSEFPLHGPPEVETLRRFLPEEKLFPVEGKLWEPHIITDDHRKQKEGMTSRESLLKNIREMAGEPRSIEEFCYLGGVAHGEFLRAQIEHYRRRKLGVGGALLWMHDEAFPSVSYGIIDYYGRPKPAYYYARRAFAPLLLVFDRDGDEMAAWVVNDLREPVEGATSLLRIQEGRADAGPERVAFRVPANAAQRIWTGPPPKDPAREWLAGTLERDGRTVARSSYFLALFREIHFPPASVAVDRSFADGTLELDLRSDVYAFAVALEGLPDGARPDDHYLDLLPGETRRITVRGLSPEDAAGVRVKTWPLASG